MGISLGSRWKQDDVCPSLHPTHLGFGAVRPAPGVQQDGRVQTSNAAPKDAYPLPRQAARSGPLAGFGRGTCCLAARPSRRAIAKGPTSTLMRQRSRDACVQCMNNFLGQPRLQDYRSSELHTRFCTAPNREQPAATLGIPPSYRHLVKARPRGSIQRQAVSSEIQTPRMHIFALPESAASDHAVPFAIRALGPTHERGCAAQIRRAGNAQHNTNICYMQIIRSLCIFPCHSRPSGFYPKLVTPNVGHTGEDKTCENPSRDLRHQLSCATQRGTSLEAKSPSDFHREPEIE